MGNIILTGDRPTGRLHLGHYVGSLKNRVALQNGGGFDKMYIMVADAQALTDNYNNVQKVRDNIIEVALDYLSCGIDPDKACVFIQSRVAALCELTFYFMNLVTLSRLERNPTVKNEIKLRGFEASLPMGFLTYPVSQASDILAFNANIVPVGEDQLPMLEQTREIARSFNNLYGEVFAEPNALLPQSSVCGRLPGTDGGGKMSKSLGNCIYLADSADEVKAKVMNMFTDPNHLKVSDPGNTDGNPVFVYLQAFCRDEHFSRYLADYANLGELEEHYRRGGLGDMKVKRFLNEVLQEELEPIRKKRAAFSSDYVFDVLKKGSDDARAAADETLDAVRSSMGINYFK
ncbi:tryptophan--tRNA ligase [Clostridia bacterium]|nr:tryptophan--tRNA ligase [Clostridia bacterium]GHV32806.1 tryptophan--tRNA ligase [Clostridia bacterium]